jgi:aryl-alcohol dehydrogenase-like predicted oxidoreductase
MQYRKFGHTDLKVSTVGFGAWAIGGGAMVGNTAIGWGDADDATSRKAVQAALDAGINFFDTADIYGLGHSETLLGEELFRHKDVIIATKVGNVARDEQFTTDYTKKYILSACEASLRRLKRDTIDYYQLHTAKISHLEQGDCLQAMQQLQQEGKIRYWGISLATFNPAPEAQYFMSHHIGHGFQLVLNMLNQRALRLVHEAGSKGYGIIARMPLQFGLLTGKFDGASTFSPNDHRKGRLTRDVIERSIEALDPVWQLCAQYSTTKTGLALSYILSYPEVSTVIPGIRTPEQVNSNTNGIVTLKKEDRELIESLGETSLAEVMSLIEQKG